ncbi:hypothetical protein O181_040217 [Austropuccinia psidii MF-1]|uniref:Reverse transcriptase Ty1/copia-type domain-containing protein n=1 Tax=Austropuccinia psidii MF-1 TaxID=1389203 RepID=A0A9Q3HDN3_9BASI|nr:hypothetical protein [Austropuccinia psidii MF-1]
MCSSRSDESLYINLKDSLFLHMHVDDGFLIGKEESKIISFLTKLHSKLKLKYQKYPTHHLGYKLDWKNNNTLYLSQQDLIRQLLYNNDMDSSRNVKTPCNGNILKEVDEPGEPIMTTEYQQAIGSLNYLVQHSRPDIMYTVNVLSRFSTRPNLKHWTALKHLMRYLEGTLNLSLVYSKMDHYQLSPLIGWADTDYANDRLEQKSISGNVVSLFGNPISWLSKKQSVVAQSTTEAEFISLNICAKQIQWLSFLVNDLRITITRPVIFNDNSGAVIISNQACLNPNTKHIEIRYQYVRNLMMKKLVDVKQVGTNEMIADVLTKPLGIQAMGRVYEMLGLKG